jgi:hypothetical protein
MNTRERFDVAIGRGSGLPAWPNLLWFGALPAAVLIARLLIARREAALLLMAEMGEVDD